MRLSKHKIEYLSDKLLKMLQEHPGVHLDTNTDLVVRCIDDAIFHNMELEDEIDAEVEAHIAENVNEIRAMDMDVGALRNKIKRELARKKGFVLKFLQEEDPPSGFPKNVSPSWPARSPRAFSTRNSWTSK